MVQAIILSGILVITLLILNSFLDSICGFDSSGNHGKVLEATLTIAILYLFIIGLFGNQLMPDGIPFVDQLSNYPSLTLMFQNKPSIFVLECVELISLTFVISLITSFIPSSFGGSGITGKILRSIVLVLVGVIANNYFLAAMKQTVFFSWAVVALQCFLSGTALAITPAAVIGSLLHLHPKNQIVSFLVEKLPQTKIGKSLSTAATNSIMLVFVIMIFESQYGSIGNLVSQAPALISLFAPLVGMILGMRLMVKSVVK